MAATDGLFSGASIGEVRQLLNKERDDRIRQAQLDNFAMTQNPYAAMIAKSNQQLAEAVTGGAKALGQATGLDTGMFAGLGQDARLTKAVERDALRTEVMDMAKNADLSKPEDVTRIANLLMQRGQPELATQFMAQAREASKEVRSGNQEGREAAKEIRQINLDSVNLDIKKAQLKQEDLQNKIDSDPEFGKSKQAKLSMDKTRAEIQELEAKAEYYSSGGSRTKLKDLKATTNNDRTDYRNAVKNNESVRSQVIAYLDEGDIDVLRDIGSFVTRGAVDDVSDKTIDEFIDRFSSKANLYRQLPENKGMRHDQAIIEVLQREGIIKGGTASKSGGGDKSSGATKKRVPIKSQRKGNQ